MFFLLSYLNKELKIPMPNILSWEDLSDLQSNDIDRVNGITNSYSNLRLFGHKESEAKLILYRDRHAWCPYCQKIWLWLELKQIPYKIEKINCASDSLWPNNLRFE